MFAPRIPLIRLERLRRSVRLAVFVLAVFVLRVGIVTACAPSDLAEALGTPSDVASLSHNDGGETDSKHASGHCLHCSCHHAVAVPSGLRPLPVAQTTFEITTPTAAHPTAPPDLSLRPPIV